MSVESLKDRRKRVRNERDKLERALAAKIAELDAAEERRAKLKKRDPEREAIEAKIKAELQVLAREVAAAEKRVDAMRSNADKLTRRIKKLGRRIRNTARPKVVDLHLVNVRPLAPLGNVIGSVGHYTAGALATTDEQAVRLWRLVDQQHKGQGWSMIGYHIGLGPEGGVYLLRPRWALGAHTANANTGRIGFSVHGTTGHTWTQPQLRAFRFALQKYGLAGKPVWGHNDLGSTACPGSFKAKYVSKGR